VGLLYAVLTKCSPKNNLKIKRNFKNKNKKFLCISVDAEKLSDSPILSSVIFKLLCE
jgi:hypothetical protein